MVNKVDMNRIALFFLLISLLVTPIPRVWAQESDITQNAQSDDYFNLPLCLPGMPDDGTCLFSGASQTVSEMRQAGIPYPFRDLPASQPPVELGFMPVYVAKINLADDQPAPMYATFEDAIAETNAIGAISRGTMRYVSYVDWMDYEGKTYVRRASGEWLKATPAAYTRFQGLIFYENPKNDFGWIMDETPSYTAPSMLAQTSGRTYGYQDLVQVYNSQEAQGLTWYQIGLNEWVNNLKIRVVKLNPIPPEGVDTGRWIDLDLLQQTMMVYENGRLLFATLMASGIEYYFTQPGLYQIYEKKPLELMQGSREANRANFYYLEDVPWTMYYDKSLAIHTAYWRTYFGLPQSHGCINLSPGDANWVYHWAELGDFVWVHDPSGRALQDAGFDAPDIP
jgi:hypothetical protein